MGAGKCAIACFLWAGEMNPIVGTEIETETDSGKDFKSYLPYALRYFSDCSLHSQLPEPSKNFLRH